MRCLYEGCDKQPSFNTPDSSQSIYCASHMKDGMVNVKDKRCDHKGCGILNPCFNTQGSLKGLYCSKHKLDGMVDVTNKRCV